MRIAIVAVGGNSLVRKGEPNTIDNQKKNLDSACDGIVEVIRQGYSVVVTHGNGPQVGDAILRSEAASRQVPPLPLDVCVAETQGSIGYLLQQILQGKLGRQGLGRPVVTIVTQVLVARRDPAFRIPDKPVGPFFDRSAAEERKREHGWTMIEDARRGFRRAVASPEPKAVIELLAISKVLETGAVVICCGGGGVPVRLENVALVGLEAVVDKDRASSLLGSQLGADLLLMSTAVDGVYLNFGSPEQIPLERISLDEARRHLSEGQFPPGSMGPKVEAAIRFLELGGTSAIITSPERIADALRSEAGTWITV